MRSPDARLDSVRWMFGRLKEQTARMFEPIAHASEGADLIVGAGAQLATASIADWREVPHAMIAFCPCAMPTGAAPPPTVKTQASSAVGQSIAVASRFAGRRRRRCAARSTAGARRSAFHPSTGRSRTSPTAASSSRPIRSWRRLATMRSPSVVSTDAMIFVEPYAPDPRVEAFLEPGSGADLRRLRQHGRVARAGARRSRDRRGPRARPPRDHCRRLGRARSIRAPDADDLLTIAATPHHAMFPRVADGHPPRRRRDDHGRGVGRRAAGDRCRIFSISSTGRTGSSGSASVLAGCRCPWSPPTSSPSVSTPRSTTRASASGPPLLGPAVAARNGAQGAVDHLERLLGSLRIDLGEARSRSRRSVGRIRLRVCVSRLSPWPFSRPRRYPLSLLKGTGRNAARSRDPEGARRRTVGRRGQGSRRPPHAAASRARLARLSRRDRVRDGAAPRRPA